MGKKTKPAASVLGEGILAKKLRQKLKKEALGYRDFSKIRGVDYLFYFSGRQDGEIGELLNLAVAKKVKFLYLFPQNQRPLGLEAIFKYQKELDLDARVVQAPIVVFEENLNPQPKENLYFEKCADEVLKIMFEDKTRGGFFKLTEPPFLERELSLKIGKKPATPHTQFFKKITSLFHFKNLFFLFALFFILPIVLTIILSFLGISQLILSRNAFLKGEIGKARVLTRGAVFSFALSQKTIKPTAFELGLVTGGGRAQIPENLLKAGSEISQGEEHLIEGVILLREKLGKLLEGEGAFDSGGFSKAQEEILSSQRKLDEALIILNSIEMGAPVIGEKLEGIKRELNDYQIFFRKAIPLLEIAPQFLGESAKKTYLVLLQNNMELRPTGGFIGSYGLLSFEKGRLLNFEVFDVYSADGQMRGHIEPPLPLKKHLPQEHWFLRDSNWDPDFSVSGSKAAWFLEKETGVKTDGVIAMDISLVGLAISGLGEINLPDYQETITQDNLFERAHFYAQGNFFPGSRAKADFLASLARAIFLKATNDEKISWPLVFKKLSEGIEEKHLLFFSNDPELQRIFSLNRLSGSPLFKKSEEVNRVNDFFMAVDANLGVNKVNYFIKREFAGMVDINDQGGITQALKITYQNQSMQDEYKNYLRVFTPSGAMLKKVEVAGEEIKEVDLEQNGDKNSFGFLIRVPVKSQKTATVVYELPEQFLKTKGLNIYNLKIFKQPGTENDRLVLTINYPDFLTFQKMGGLSDGRLFPASQALNIATTLSKDQEYNFEFLNK